jgi:hypothetical protein
MFCNWLVKLINVMGVINRLRSHVLTISLRLFAQLVACCVGHIADFAIRAPARHPRQPHC